MDVLQEGFDALTDTLDANEIFGEPVEVDGRVRIPVQGVSIWGIALPRGGTGEEARGGQADSGLGTWKRTRELGHISVDSSGVRWHPKISTMRLALASFGLFASLFSLAKKRSQKAESE